MCVFQAQIELIIALQLPFFVIMTKIDICTRAMLTNTLKEVQVLGDGCMCRKSDHFLPYCLIFVFMFIWAPLLAQTSFDLYYYFDYFPYSLTLFFAQLMQFLKGPGCRRVPVLVNNTDDVCVLGTSYGPNQ